MDTKLMNTPVTNFEALVGQARDCGLTQTFATAYEVNKALDEADCCGGSGGDCSELEAQIQALEAEVAALEAENSTLETENNTLEASNTQLESQIASISTLSVTENGKYTPEPNTLGWNNVEVNVAGGGGSEVLVIQDDTQFRCENTELPFKIDSSAVTEFSRMFSSCGNLITIPSLNTSKGTKFNYMFSNCRNLMTIPPLDTSNGTNFSYMFSYCTNLTTFPPLDTSKGTSFNGMLNGDNNLITIPPLNASNVTDFNYMFSGCSNIENITFIGSINANIDFSPCHKKLTYDSVKSILTACSNTINTTAKTLKFNRTLTDQNSELTDLIATCTSKGWTISGLTLN